MEIISKKDDLKKVINYIGDKKVFIDYFRASNKKYGNQYEASKVQLSLEISRNEDEYIDCLKASCEYSNVIPVISIKADFDMNKLTLDRLYDELGSNDRSVAFRITSSCFNNYEEFVLNKLQDKDFLLYDIEETSALSKVMEFEELSMMDIRAKKILLNSPREGRLTNGEFEENDICALIDNRVAVEYSNDGFDGFGDYCGYKDVLPRKDGSNMGRGAAISLIYDFKINAFYSFVEKDTSKGVQGYKEIVEKIMQRKNEISDFDTCVAMNKVVELSLSIKKGNWATWIGITITRYIYQMYLYI